MTRQVFGITGQKRHGKDTLAGFMAEVGGLQVMHFADRLKEICRTVYCLTDAQLFGDQKETPFATPVILDRQLDALCKETGLWIAPRGLAANNARELMQFVGTEYVRNTNRTYWVDHVLEKIRNSDLGVVVADVRFPNELFELQQLGACCIRVVRTGAGSDSSHASETQIPALRVDLEVTFPEGRFDLIQAVATGLVTLNTGAR